MIEIIIPAYNCTKTLGRTLASLQAQTFTDFKVHIIDDCSAEDLMSVIVQASNLNIRVTRNKINKGCGMSRQVGIDLTRADYIAFLDSDDVLMPYTVETWHYMSENNPDIDVFHAWFYEQFVAEKKVPVLSTVRDGFTWCHGKLYKVDFLRKYNIHESPEVRWADDSLLNSQCTELGRIGVIEFPMYMWLNNQESITRNPNGAFRLTDDNADDFVHAMRLSVENTLRFKDHIDHLPHTMAFIETVKENIKKRRDDYIYLQEVNELYQTEGRM